MSAALALLGAVVAVPFAEPPAVTLFDPDALTVDELYGDESALPFADDEGYVYARRNLKGYALTNDARCLPEGHPDLVANRSIDNPTCESVRACWHPSDPAGTRRHLYTQVDTTSLMSAPHDGAVVWDQGLVALAEASNGIFARTFRCTADGVPEGDALKINAGAHLPRPPFYYAPFMLGRRVCGFWNPAFFTGSSDVLDLACVATPDDYAVHSSGAPLFAGQTVLSLRDLDAHLGIPPLAPNADASVRKVRDTNGTVWEAFERWFATPDHLVLPDGRVLITLVRQSVASAGDAEAGRWQNTRWLFLVAPDADGVEDLTLIRRPTWPIRKLWPGAADPDLALGRPFYEPTQGLILFEAAAQEFANRRFTICEVTGECAEDVPLGFFQGTTGFHVLDLASTPPYLGYVSATDAFWSTTQQYDSGGGGGTFGGGTYNQGATLGRLGVRLAWRFSAPGTVAHTHVLRFHPDRFDLDGDGLTAPEEAALGTSDHDFNSDDDYLSDAAEARLGYDPADAAEAPILPDGFGALQVTTSPLVQRRFGDKVPRPYLTAGADTALVRSHAPDGPLCARDADPEGGTHSGICWDASGREVARFPDDDAPLARALAHDGRSLVTLTADHTLEVFDLETAAKTTLGAVTVPELDTGAELRIFPRDATTVFLARVPSLHPAIWRFDGGETTLVFDLDAAELAAGMTLVATGTLPTMGLTHEHFEVLGFVGSLDRDATPDDAELMVSVQGHWRRYVIAIAEDGTVREVARWRDGGLGDMDRSAEWLGGLWVDGPLLGGDGRFLFPSGLRLFTGDSFWYRPVPAFGSLLTEQRVPGDGLVQPQQSGLHEYVAFGPRLEPGETLVFISRWSGALTYLGYDRWVTEVRGDPGMLFRVGTRGGMVPAWSLDPATFDYDFVDVSGVDLDAGHHLCVADRGADVLRVYRPTQTGGVPEVLAERVSIPGIVDCRWRADGALSILVEVEGDAGLSSRTLTRAATAARHDAGAFAPDAGDPGAAQRRAFEKGPGIDLGFVDHGRAAFVAGPEAGHARVDYDQESGRLSTPWGEVVLEDLAEGASPSVALRPDGLTIVLPSIVYRTVLIDGFPSPRAEPLVLVDPTRPDAPTMYVGLGDQGRGMVAVAVPWDRFVDPWTGAPLDPANPLAADVTPTFPPPTAPTGGTPVEPEHEPEPDGCASCTGSTGAGWAHLLVAALLALVAFARRAQAVR